MGLCWSNNTHYWGKDKFPYKEAAPMSSKLWMKLTGARWVICEFGALFHTIDRPKWMLSFSDYPTVASLLERTPLFPSLLG